MPCTHAIIQATVDRKLLFGFHQVSVAVEARALHPAVLANNAGSPHLLDVDDGASESPLQLVKCAAFLRNLLVLRLHLASLVREARCVDRIRSLGIELLHAYGILNWLRSKSFAACTTHHLLGCPDGI